MRFATAVTDVVLRKTPSSFGETTDELSRNTAFIVLDGPVSSTTGHPWFKVRVYSVPNGVSQVQVGEEGYVYGPNLKVEDRPAADPMPASGGLLDSDLPPPSKGSDPLVGMAWALAGVAGFVLLVGWAIYYFTR